MIRKARPSPPAFQEAIRLLRITDRSRAALTERLAGRGCDEREIGAALERLTALGYVDDQRLALAKAKTLLEQGKGPALIAARLEQLGIPPALVQKTIAGLSLDERGLIERALAEQLGSGFSPAELRRVGRRLITRGFSPDLVDSAVAERIPEEVE